MGYVITFWSRPYLKASGKSTTREETAKAALATATALIRSDETVEITDDNGHYIAMELLRVLAEEEEAAKP